MTGKLSDKEIIELFRICMYENAMQLKELPAGETMALRAAHEGWISGRTLTWGKSSLERMCSQMLFRDFGVRAIVIFSYDCFRFEITADKPKKELPK